MYKGDVLAVCSPACQNSGTCSSPGTCNCQSGYSGTRCETGIFVFSKSKSQHSVNVEINILHSIVAPSCFYGKDTVSLVDGGRRSIENLVVGDRIWSLNHRGTQLIEDEVIIMADNGPNKQSNHLFI